MEDVKRILCTVCGENVMLRALKDTGQYSYKSDGKKYKVYVYDCPVCYNKMLISEKFLEGINS